MDTIQKTMASHKEAYDLANLYKMRLLNIISKRTGEVMVTVDEQATVSHYSHRSKKVTFRSESNTSTKFHEFGHFVFHSLNGEEKIDIEELFNFAEEFISWDNEVEDVLAILQLLKEEYKTNIEGLIPVSDYLGMIVGKKINGFYSHPDEYALKRDSSIYANETFANICGIIGSMNIPGMVLLQKEFPNLLASCLDLIDEAIKELPINRGI